MDAAAASSSALRRWSPVLGGLGVGLALAVVVGATYQPPVSAASALSASARAPAPPASPAPPAASASTPAPAAPGRFAEEVTLAAFYKGNVHTHTNWSDGDTSPEDVIGRYRDAGYDFLAITDHNTFTNPALFGRHAKPKMVLVAGEEVTFWSSESGTPKPVHVNALCAPKQVGYRHTFATNVEALRAGIAAVHAHEGAVALVNHPNYEWALRPDDVLAARDAELLEIWSGHPNVHNDGDAEHPSHVALWDLALRSGVHFGPAAVDDAHNYKTKGKGGQPARPFRAWIEVAAERLEPKSLCKALRERRHYASNGPKIASLEVKGDAFVVRTAEAARVEFIGGRAASGALPARTETLAVVEASREARYALRGGETYVRAEVKDASGRVAWTQAYVVK